MPGPLESALGSILEAPEHARRAARLIVALAQNRVELLGVEAREESLFLLRLFLTAAAAFLFLALAVLLGTFTVVFAVAPEYRLLALLVATALYAAIGLVLALVARHKVKQASPPFAQTVEELRKDKECL
jgi:uncharacterized membrane protein YqjE